VKATESINDVQVHNNVAVSRSMRLACGDFRQFRHGTVVVSVASIYMYSTGLKAAEIQATNRRSAWMCPNNSGTMQIHSNIFR